MLAGVEVPDELMVGLVVATFSALLASVAMVVRLVALLWSDNRAQQETNVHISQELKRTSELFARVEERMDNHGNRLAVLEHGNPVRQPGGEGATAWPHTGSPW